MYAVEKEALCVILTRNHHDFVSTGMSNNKMDIKSGAMHIGTSNEPARERSSTVSEVYALLTGAYRRSSVASRNLDEVDRSGGRGRGRRSVYTDSESLDFDETESITWRKHHLRRYFQDSGLWWTADRKAIAWRWTLVVLTGALVACMGAVVQILTQLMNDFKYETLYSLISLKKQSEAYFFFLGISLAYSFAAGLLCLWEPFAAGSGIPEIKAYLNGVNLNNVVRLRVLWTKVLGMCLSVASGLPLGKEGPMIHAGSIIGAAVSQGNTITFGFDTSWSVFQDLRNDQSKRDFVTIGAAAGIAAAFKAPIGGILFTLEEGASFWSTSLTFRAFFCALITELSFTILFNGFTITATSNAGEFAFGSFDTFLGYRTYELIVFTLMGTVGGLSGALFNYINKKMTLFRQHRYQGNNLRRFVELLVITGLFSTVCFVLPLMWYQCTPLPTDTADWTPQEYQLLNQLVQLNCPDNQYNQLASLYLVGADTAMQQLYHFKEINGTTYVTFDTGCLCLFFIPYFLFAAITSGTLAPAGLFVPTLLSGAAFGRIVGRILNAAFPGMVADSGTYALIGAAAILGGMSRSTIAATVIVLEACGNNAYLLPLMLTFAAARYTGNVINESMYDMQIELKEMPFLEETVGSVGLLKYHTVTEVMAKPVLTVKEVNLVQDVYEALSRTNHNGFPVVNDEGHLRGFILRKTLCGLLKLKAFSTPTSTNNASRAGIAMSFGAGIGTGAGGNSYIGGVSSSSLEHGRHTVTGAVMTDSRANFSSNIDSDNSNKSSNNKENSNDNNDDSNNNSNRNSDSNELMQDLEDIELQRNERDDGDDVINTQSESDSDVNTISLTTGAVLFHETLEQSYPNYPTIKDIQLTEAEKMNNWLDLRPYMDSAPYSINETCSVKRCYRLFRTMGLRHLVVVDGDHKVTGIITRSDISQHRLHHYWSNEGRNIANGLNIDTVMEPARVSNSNSGSGSGSGTHARSRQGLGSTVDSSATFSQTNPVHSSYLPRRFMAAMEAVMPGDGHSSANISNSSSAGVSGAGRGGGGSAGGTGIGLRFQRNSPSNNPLHLQEEGADNQSEEEERSADTISSIASFASGSGLLGSNFGLAGTTGSSANSGNRAGGGMEGAFLSTQSSGSKRPKSFRTPRNKEPKSFKSSI